MSAWTLVEAVVKLVRSAAEDAAIAGAMRLSSRVGVTRGGRTQSPPRTTEEGMGHQPETACCFLKFGGLQRRRRRWLKTRRIRMTFVKRCLLTCALNDFERRRHGAAEPRTQVLRTRLGPTEDCAVGPMGGGSGGPGATGAATGAARASSRTSVIKILIIAVVVKSMLNCSIKKAALVGTESAAGGII